MSKTLIAMSGGVDSSVSAYLMVKEGHECIGVNMKLHTGAEEDELGGRQKLRRYQRDGRYLLGQHA